MSCEDFISRFFQLINRRDMDALEGILQEAAEFYFPKTQASSRRSTVHSSPFIDFLCGIFRGFESKFLVFQDSWFSALKTQDRFPASRKYW